MTSRCLVLFLLGWGLSVAQVSSAPQKPLSKIQVEQLVVAGMDNEQLAKNVRERGLDFELTGEFLVGLRQKGALPVLVKTIGEIALNAGQGPLDKDTLQELVVAGVDNLSLKKAVVEKGIDFQPPAEYLRSLQASGATGALIEALREAVPRVLTEEQVLNLVASGVPADRVTTLVKRRGINFKPTEEYLETLRIAGAGATVLEALRQAKRPPTFTLAHTLVGHERVVKSLAFSPDGEYLASGSGDGTVRLWEISAVRDARTLKGHSAPVENVAFSPDGRLLASGSRDRTIKLWEVASGREPRTLAAHEGDVSALAFGPDGKVLASGSQDNTIKFWDVESGNETKILKGHAGTINSVAFTPDGRYLASACWDKTVKVWNSQTGQEVRTLEGHTDGVDSLAFSPDGRILATAGHDKTIKIWDVDSGRLLRTLAGHALAIRSVAFTPDGRYLASASADDSVKLWVVGTGAELFTLKEPLTTVAAIAFSPDGRYFAAGCDEKILLWRRE